MFLPTLRSLRGTLALRLTAWYGGIFAAWSLLAFALVYALMIALVQSRTDADLHEDIGEFAALLDMADLERVKSDIRLETQGGAAEDVFLRLWSTDGRLLMASDLSAWSGLPDLSARIASGAGLSEPVIGTLELPQREYATRTIYGRIGPELVLEVGESLEDDEDLLESLFTGFLIVLATVILLGAPIGWFMARRALRGVEEVTRTAMDIADGALDQRVTPVARGDEIDRLAQAFNTMLDRIQALILGMREMTDNLAHDLRSPVARIRASAEMALAGDGSSTGWKELATDTTEECDRLLEMINTTLDIAEAESGAAKLRIAAIDLVEIVGDACDLFGTVAEDKGITLWTELPERCVIRADRQRLQRVLANLLDNALKYTPPGGRVTVGLVEDDGRVRLSVSDNGVGISVEDQSRIFQRFYRCDWSRSEYGNGLGLSLALAFVRAHGGDITVHSRVGEGSSFTVLLPLHGRAR